MPYSSDATDATVVRFLGTIAEHRIKKALDVGVGAGKYGKILKDTFPGIEVHGIEGYSKYLADFKAQHRAYASVLVEDARTWLKTHHDWKMDLVVFGDVLEHFGFSEALDAVHRAAYHARFMLLVWPERRPQGVYDGNELEVHSCVLLPTDFSRFKTLEYATIRTDRFAKHVMLLEGVQ